MTSLTPSALTFEDVLRALQGPWSGPGNTLGQLAARTGRDKSNLRRDLFKLVEQGLAQGNPNDGWTLGEGGMPALNAIDRANAEGVQVAGLPLWPLDQIELNPDNPRKTIVQAPLEGLADTIAFAEGLLQPIVLYPVGASGARMLHAGERRVRACRLLQAEGRLPAALAKGLPFIEREASKAEALFIGLVENSQREGLTAFEDAKGLKAFADETGLSARAIAFKLGRAREGSEEGVRDVQEKIAVLRKAKPEAQQEVEEGRQSFDWLKRQIRKTVEEVAGQLRPIDLMVLAEVKHRCRVHPRGRHNTGETECSYLAAKDPVLKSLTAQGLLRLTEQSYDDHKAYIGPGHSGYSVFAAEELDGLSREEADAQQVLYALRIAAVGEDKANAARNTKRFVTDWLNGPFALSPKAAAKVAEAKATKVEIREKSKAQKAAVDKRMAEVAELGALAQASIDAPPPSSPSGLAVEAIAQAFNAVNIALPVKVAGRSIIDANDNTIVPNLAWRFYEKEPVALELLVIALNAAFGFPTARPDTPATADEESAHAAA
jgi:ParB/RepB/Spo0J family partition protein